MPAHAAFVTLHDPRVLPVGASRDRVERVLALVETVDPFYRLAELFGR